MQDVRTLRTQGLDHGERERLIFSNVESLAVGQAVRIAAEFNPLPLVYLLKSRGEFEVGYDQEGPVEWILRVSRTAPTPQRRDRFRELLRELRREGASEQVKAEAKEFFQAVDAKTLGDLEQELIHEGVSHEEIRQSLCDIHLEVMRDALVANRIEVAAPHPVHTLMEEHKVIVASLNELGELAVENFV